MKGVFFSKDYANICILGVLNAAISNPSLTLCLENQNFKKLIKILTGFKPSNGSAFYLILTNNSYLYEKSKSFKTGMGDHNHITGTMSKSEFERMSSKIITYQSYKNFMDEKFQEAIRSDSSDIGGGNLTSLQYLIAKRLDELAPMKKIILHGINKPHLTSQLKMLPLKDLD